MVEPGRHIGLFGGTFNPIHNGHLTVARHCRDVLNLDAVWLIPAAHPPHRQDDLAPADARHRMVALAVSGEPGLVCSDLEQRHPGPSYTINTLEQAQTELPDHAFTLILGQDAMAGIASWHRPEDVLRAVPIAVVHRPGADFSVLADQPLLHDVDFAPLTPWAAAPRTPLDLRGDSGTHLILIPMAPAPESATAIRDHLKKQRSHIPGLPRRVTEFILSEHLYA